MMRQIILQVERKMKAGMMDLHVCNQEVVHAKGLLQRASQSEAASAA